MIYEHQTAISFSERQDFHTQCQICSGNHVVFNLEKPRRNYRLFEETLSNISAISASIILSIAHTGISNNSESSELEMWHECATFFIMLSESSTVISKKA